MFDIIKSRFSGLPDKKKWIDVITATLTIPVLLTVIVANLNNIKTKEVKSETQTSPTQAPIIVRDFIPVLGEQSETKAEDPIPTASEETKLQPTSTQAPTQAVSVTPSCKVEPVPYEITFPSENETVDVDPVCVVLQQKDQGHCSTKWAYRINNSTWSTYTKDPICLYNMANGNIKLEVRVKSDVSGQEKTYTRNFIYEKEETTGTATPSPSASPSPTSAQ